ncbi:MAG: CapA family protein [Bacteroidales bacterium]|nr:CapA family protein [Bacteroidales bacterium]
MEMTCCALRKKHIHILSAISAAICMSAHGGHVADAQEIMMKEAWKNAISCVPDLYMTDTLSLCFLGDVMMHTTQIVEAQSNGRYDFSSYFELIEDRISSADLAIANMEFTLGGEPYTGYPCFSAPDSFADYLADVGFDVFLAANNHIFDRGSSGAARTLDIYRRSGEEKGILFTGLAGNEKERNANTPLIILRKGIRIGLINMTYGTNLGRDESWPRTNYIGERDFLKEAFERARNKGADLVIALPHWGPEYVLRHSSAQEETASSLADYGADVIIGAHPHVVQDTSSIKGVLVAYSLGNAVSNMSAPNTQLELMATLKIVRHKNGDIEVLPLELTWLWCSRPGGFRKSYTVIPVEEYIGSKETWMGTWEYEKMITTYERVKNHIK